MTEQSEDCFEKAKDITIKVTLYLKIAISKKRSPFIAS